jgi:hypothetical protein
VEVRWEPRLRLVKKFENVDGRAVFVYQDGDAGWIVELRPATRDAADKRRARWTVATELEAADICFAIMGSQHGWSSVWD